MSNSIIQNNNIDHICLNIPNKLEYVSVVRLTASAIANRVGFNVEDIEDIKVAIAEACISFLESNNEVKNLDIDFYIFDDKLEIKVKNFSILPKSQKSFEVKSDKSKEKVLGLFIIKSLMDETEFVIKDEKSKEIKMIKKIEDDFK